MFNYEEVLVASKSIIKNIKTNCIPLLEPYDVFFDLNQKPTSKKYLNIIYLKENKKIMNLDSLQFMNEPSKLIIVLSKNYEYQDIIQDLNIKIKPNKMVCIENLVFNNFRYLVFRPVRKFLIPKFDYIDKKTNVLLHEDFGYGDFFYGLRYLNLYKNVLWTFEGRDSLVKFAKNLNLFENVILKNEININYKLDFHIGINELAEHHKFCSFKSPFIKFKNFSESKFDVSFCYKGNKVKMFEARREFDPFILKNLSKKYSLCNLQIDEQELSWGINLKNKIKNWYDTAKIIKQSSLVVCPPTGLMHLAGSLNVPTIVVFSSCFKNYERLYFNINKKLSPFYPDNLICVDESKCVYAIECFLSNKQKNIKNILNNDIFLI